MVAEASIRSESLGDASLGFDDGGPANQQTTSDRPG